MTSPTLRDPAAHAADDVAQGLGVDPSRGLVEHEAARRLERDGRNELRAQRATGLPAMLADAITEPFVVLLAVAGILTILLGETRDGLLVLAGLLPIVGADVVTEFRSERALAALRAASAPRARVRREGRVFEVAAAVLVRGDIVLLRTGDVVPADLRLLSADGLHLDRSVLTGEPFPEPAVTTPDPGGVPATERRSIAFAGTGVVHGRGEGVVVATGRETELGRIAGSLEGARRPRSPVQRELDRLVRILLVAAAALVVVTAGLGFLRGNSPGENLLAGVSAAIAAIPEEPPVLIAVVLGLGAFRLLRRGVLVRRLNAQETLGAVDLVVTDKTGTLTTNRLQVARVGRPSGVVDDPERLRGYLTDALRAEDDAWEIDDAVVPGSFTRAIVAALASLSATPVLDRGELLEAAGFREGHPFSQTRTHRDGRVEEVALGAPEAVLALADGIPAPELEVWRRVVETETEAGGRVVVLARRRDGESWQPAAVITFVDPVRHDAADALADARRAGIRVLMVTGDHPETARAVARQLGLRADSVVTGADVAGWDDAQLHARIAGLDLVARAVPAQKLRLVRAARGTGRTVAVTGDGVNDAPALQHADVAVSMASGSAVAREASDLVLGDDSFATLMHALAEGRRIVANVQKGLVFLVSTHLALLGYILLATLSGQSQPLLPIQILWLELFIDTTTSVAFEREPAEREAMRRPPRPRETPLLSPSVLLRIAGAGGWSALGALALFALAGGDEHARWLAFTALVVGQLVRAYANRSLTAPVRSLGRNTFLLLTCVTALVAQLVIPLVPALADAFRATPLTLAELGLVALVALAPAALAEIVRARRGAVWVA